MADFRIDLQRKRLTACCLLCSVGLLVLLVLGDGLVRRAGHASLVLAILVDEAVHAGNAAAVFFPCLLLERRFWPYVILAFLAGSLIDVDHFVAARSLSLAKAAGLSQRPPTHSLTFAFAAAFVVAVLFKQRIAGWVIGVAIACHVVRDAAGGARLLYPSPWPDRIPAVWYYLVEMAFVFVASHVLWSAARARIEEDS